MGWLNNKKNKFFFAVNKVPGFISDRKGYIDPGTGGMILGGSIWPIIVAFFAAIGGFFVKFFWKPLKGRAAKMWRK